MAATEVAATEQTAKEETQHDRVLRLYFEKSRQETLRQQLLELELKKATEKLKQTEEAARQRLFNVSAFAEQQVHALQTALIPYAPAPSPPPPAGHGYASTSNALIHAPPPPPPPPHLPLVSAPSIIAPHSVHHHHHAHDHHYHLKKYSHLSEEEIAIRRHRRERHRCSSCNRLGHYSKECRFSPPRRRMSSPSRPGPALASPVRGYLTSTPGSATASTVGGYSTEDEDWQLIPGGRVGDLVLHKPLNIDDNGYPIAKRLGDMDDEYDSEEERRDNGVLVYYDGGGAPGTAWPRNSVRHVIA